MPSLAAITATGGILAAFILGSVSFIGHWITRSSAKFQVEVNREMSKLAAKQSSDNAKLSTKLAANLKLAEMRQAWINSLREDMAAFQSLGVTPGNDHKNNEIFYKLATRIQLSMNPEDPNYPALHKALHEFIGATSVAEKYAANPKYVAVCQRILKREWDVLKREIKEIND